MIVTGKAKQEARRKREAAQAALVSALRPIITNHRQFERAVAAAMNELEHAGFVPAVMEAS